MSKHPPLEVHWITYPHNPEEQGWATVWGDISAGNYIFYGAAEFEMAMLQAELSNRGYGYNEPVKVVGKEESIRADYTAYQWMQ